MQEEVTAIIAHMARSHSEMARMLEAKRQTICSVSHIVTALPNETIQFAAAEQVSANSLDVTKSVTAYLGSLADLADALGDNLELVMKEMAEHEEE